MEGSCAYTHARQYDLRTAIEARDKMQGFVVAGRPVCPQAVVTVLNRKLTLFHGALGIDRCSLLLAKRRG